MHMKQNMRLHLEGGLCFFLSSKPMILNIIVRQSKEEMFVLLH